MKKIILPLLLCAALCGCGGAAAGNAVQDQYRTVRTARLEAEVTSHTDTDSRTFPWIAEREASGALRLSGLHFGIAAGILTKLTGAKRFERLD